MKTPEFFIGAKALRPLAASHGKWNFLSRASRLVYPCTKG
jgi:hypothetical protein